MRVLPLETVVTHKVRVINKLYFDLFNRAKKGELNAETDVNSVPPSLCAEALLEFLTNLLNLKAENPKLCLLMVTTDVNDAYRNVKIDPNQAHNFCYTVGDLVVIDFRLMFGWTGSPGNFGVMASAGEHYHRNSDLSNVQLLPEGVEMMEHVEMSRPLGSRRSHSRTAGQKYSCEQGGKAFESFPHGGICRRPRPNKSPAIGRGQISYSCVGLARIGLRMTFGPGKPGETSIPAPKKNSNWNTTLEFLGFIINSHTLEISLESTSDTDGTGR